jgi:hypothetical protein
MTVLSTTGPSVPSATGAFAKKALQTNNSASNAAPTTEK